MITDRLYHPLASIAFAHFQMFLLLLHHMSSRWLGTVDNVPCILLPEDEMWDQAAFGSSPPRLTASQWMTDLLRNSFKLTSSSDGEEREHASPGRDTNIRVSQWMDGYLNSSNDGLSVLLNVTFSVFLGSSLPCLCFALVWVGSTAYLTCTLDTASICHASRGSRVGNTARWLGNSSYWNRYAVVSVT